MIIIFNIELDNTFGIGSGTMAQETSFDTADVLAYLDVPHQAPSLAYLQTLMHAYTRTVPWESASRIANRAQSIQPETCARFANTFWQDSIRYGTGGTCFESNYAFLTLLEALGFTGYLTINNMNESIGCHTAIIITLDGQKYMVDVGLPVYVPLRLNPNIPTKTPSAFHTYTATPEGDNTYVITRNNHPRSYCFTLIDTPIADDSYRRATINDYGEDGLFLDKIVIVRVVDGQQWRFGGQEAPYHLESFADGGVTYHLLGDDIVTVAEKVSAQFDIDMDVIHNALKALPAK